MYNEIESPHSLAMRSNTLAQRAHIERHEDRCFKLLHRQIERIRAGGHRLGGVLTQTGLKFDREVSDGYFWLLYRTRSGEKAATRSTDINSTDRRHHFISIVAGILLALLIAAGLLILFITANHV